ncbi:MAG TPA: polymer-forming cytoskeletal protein [Candidatus Methylomirabilis sp.]|nr:polymer-forming cytoskeletal protein [Candidatus Methylomirabilis sp.]
MWRKSEHDKSVPDTSSPADAAVHHPSSAQQVQSSSAPATVNQHIKIKGEVSGRGDFLLDGELEGKVCLADGTFTVGPNARVTAEIEARQIIIRGEVVGSLKAHERIQILSTAKVTGDMDARGIAIEDGAELHSKVKTPGAAGSQPAPSEAPSPEAAKSTRPLAQSASAASSSSKGSGSAPAA